MTDDRLTRRLRELGNVLTPESIRVSRELFAPLHAPLRPGLRVVRDARYGPAERHRLDLFVDSGAPTRDLGAMGARPVLLFVHGGGFVMGDKSMAGSPYWDNVPAWAAGAGFLGANMTYRLAPQHRWPSGCDDVAAAVAWLREHVGAQGGDPQRIFVMGQSAGAVHVAHYLARTHAAGEGNAAWRPAAAILVSGLYDVPSMERNAFFEAYFGNDPAGYAGADLLDALAGTPVPLMAAVAEWDPLEFLAQGVKLLAARLARTGSLPRFVQLTGHNHLSTVLQLGTPGGEPFADELLDFMRSTNPP